MLAAATVEPERITVELSRPIWVSGTVGQEITGLPQHRLRRLAAAGRIRSKCEEFSRTRYRLSDLLRLAASNPEADAA